MRHFAKAIVFVVGLATVAVQAQEQDVFSPPPRQAGHSNSAHQPGPARRWTSANREEMAREYIRIRAQEKAEARIARMEGMRALGFSPQRPTMNATPFMGHPPTWSVSHIWAYPAGVPVWYYPGTVPTPVVP